MAREEVDREDLIGEATALVERVELTMDGADAPVVVGFRRNGAVSCFFGAEPVYQFTSDGLLRRAYAGERLIKAEHGRLVALERRRTTGEVALVRHEWNDVVMRRFLDRTANDLVRLRDALASGRYRTVRQVPEHADVVARVRQWLATLRGRIQVADTMRVA
ncbi:MAG: hypothetical protein R3C10_09905 [Pirellulales bacterium]|nr:hypothetical protein [Planctomycetales bacterium]